MSDMYQQLAQKVYAVLDAYANQQKFTLVLDASNQQNSPVLWASPATDITKAVVDAYNAKSGVPPQPAAGAAALRGPAHTPSHWNWNHPPQHYQAGAAAVEQFISAAPGNFYGTGILLTGAGKSR